MLALRDLLDRFRRGLAPPGPALARVAPPVDRRVLLEAELADVFTSVDSLALDPDERAAEARRGASATIDDARAAADELLRRTDRGLADLRAAAAADRRREMDEEVTALEVAAEAERARIEERATERIPALVDEVMARVTEGIG